MGDTSIASGFRTGIGSAFLQFGLERLASFGSLAWKEISVIWGVEEELDRLQRTFFKIQGLVDHVDSSSLRLHRGGKAWELLFEKLRRLAYDADALLDHTSLHLSTYCSHNSITSNQEKQVRAMVLSLREFNLPHEISEMQNKLDELAKEMEGLVMIEKTKFDVDVISGRSSHMSSSYNLEEPWFVDVKTIVGRADEKESIINFLNDDNFDESVNFSVLSIMGMGGIGKTAVARLVYDDESVKYMFNKRIWVSVSVNFDAIKITRDSDTSPSNLSDLRSLQQMLLEELSYYKFLLVLDDYWSEKCHDWDTLSAPFRSGGQGSKVIVTTRNMKVSSIVSSREKYILQILPDDDCWKLIKQRAMMSMESIQNLESIGVEIARKCKGLPLVATTLGDILRCKYTEEEWHFVLDSELWDMPQDNNVFLHLMQSYVHIPTQLQKCLAYCSIFPQGYEFEIEELIMMWMAEGYVQPIRVQNSERLVARDYFNELKSKFFFHECRSASNQIRYKMHDLIYDMVRLVSKDICFHAKHDESNSYPLFGNACHLSLLHDGIQRLELKASVKNERLRTFLLMTSNARRATTLLDPQLFSYLKFLRVLGLGAAGLTELLDSIVQLQYLRYLNLSDNPISRLPKSICKIVALQILKLRNCPRFDGFPEEMSNLINLQHLEFDERMFTPPHLRKLAGLQYLSAYIVGKKNGCGIGELKSLNCLGGRLCIKKIEVSNASEAREAKLEMKRYLDKLELEWSTMDDDADIEKMLEQANVFAQLRPHTSLKEVVVTNYFGMTYPAWLSDPSHKLTTIHLKGLNYCEHLPSLGELPKLTSFSISNMPCLLSIDQAFYGANNEVKFPSLKSFQLRGLSRMTHWEEADENEHDKVMPCLRVFTLRDCEELSRLPQNLQALLHVSSVTGCPRLQP